MPEPVHGVTTETERRTRRSSRDRADAGRNRGARAAAGGRRQRLSDRSRCCALGKLHRVYPGVYAAVAPELLTEEGQLMAALLGAGEGALLSHGTAAWRWRIIPAPPSVMQLALPRDHAQMEGVTLFVSRNLRADDVTLNGRFPSTTPARTLLDLATRYTHRALLRALAEAEFQHDLRPAGHQPHAPPRPPRQRQPARRAETSTRPATAQMKSGLERRFRAAAHPPRGSSCRCATSPSARGPSTACGRSAASPSSSTGASTSARARPTQTTTAISGSAATATSRAATASARSTSGPTT